MTKGEREKAIEQWRARFARARVEAQRLLDEDLDRAAEKSDRIVARALRQLRRTY